MPPPQRRPKSANTRIADLINDIDAYTATSLHSPIRSWHEDQQQQQRRGSASSTGTMFVDFDEHGEIKVSYRNGRSSASYEKMQTYRPGLVSAPPRPQPTQKLYRGQRNSHDGGGGGVADVRHVQRVAGIDMQTGFEYDYDGRIVHVHRGRTRSVYTSNNFPPRQYPRAVSPASSFSSVYSEYLPLDARDYEVSRGDAMRIENAEPPRNAREVRKREKVVSFVKELCRKLERTGWMRKFKDAEDRGKKRDGSSRRSGSRGSAARLPTYVHELPAMSRSELIPEPLTLRGTGARETARAGSRASHPGCTFASAEEGWKGLPTPPRMFYTSCRTERAGGGASSQRSGLASMDKQLPPTPTSMPRRSRGSGGVMEAFEGQWGSNGGVDQ